MTFTIGGIDLIMQGPKTSAPWKIIFQLSHELWPNSVFQDADEEGTHPVSQVMTSKPIPNPREFFIYRDDANARSWEKDGRTTHNQYDMLHFLLFEEPDHPDRLQVTV